MSGTAHAAMPTSAASSADAPIAISIGPTTGCARPTRSRLPDSPAYIPRNRGGCGGMAGLLSAVEQDTTVEAWEPLSWGLPGQGEPAEDCGKYRPRWVCAGERVVWLCRRECRRRECPYCYLAWARGEARIAARRILLHPTGGIATRPRIVSPAPGWAPTAAEYDTARRQMYLSLRAEGWTGYCVVYHPYRGRDTGEARKCYDVPGGHWHVTGWKEIGPTTPQFPPP